MWQLRPGLKPTPYKDMSEHERKGVLAHRRATRKMRKELRMHSLPMIIERNGKVIEIPA